MSKPVYGDSALRQSLLDEFDRALPSAPSLTSHNNGKQVASYLPTFLNASADSFYASQGRSTAFPDANEGVLELLASLDDGSKNRGKGKSGGDCKTLEMETHHLFHLAACWNRRYHYAGSSNEDSVKAEGRGYEPEERPYIGTRIRTAAVHTVFADRRTRAFITPQLVDAVETWAGKAVLEALARVV